MMNEETDQWTGLDATLRRVLTPIAQIACLALAVHAVERASQGEKLGGYGSLLVLIVCTVMGVKLVAETYLFSALGGDESPRQRSAQRTIGPLKRLAQVRYFFGVMGGIILPLGAQILAAGAKNIPAAVDAGPSAICACLAAACLLIGEAAERRLFRRAMDPSLDATATDAV